MMKKIHTRNYLSNLPTENGISVFSIIEGIDNRKDYFKVLSHVGLQFINKRYVWADNDYRIFWGMDHSKFNTRYGVLHPEEFGKKKFHYDLNLRKESFLLKIKEWYPDDYQFFIWYPEALNFEWNSNL